MKLKKFHEYLNSKGQVDKPVVKLDGDRIDPATSPDKPKGGKPYKGGKPKKAGSKGFGDEGDASLKYNPKVDNDNKGKAPAKLPTVEQVETASLATKAIKNNPQLMETLIFQFKANGLMGALVAEMLNHKETFNHISEVMAHDTYGPDICQKLVRAMKEEVAAPFSDQLDTDDEEDLDADDDMNHDHENGEDEEFGVEDDDDLDVGIEDGDEMADPNADPNLGDPNMDPNAAAMDPAMMGMDPSMMGQMPPVDPMMGMNPAMTPFQHAMMRAYQRAMMSKK